MVQYDYNGKSLTRQTLSLQAQSNYVPLGDSIYMNLDPLYRLRLYLPCEVHCSSSNSHRSWLHTRLPALWLFRAFCFNAVRFVGKSDGSRTICPKSPHLELFILTCQPETLRRGHYSNAIAMHGRFSAAFQCSRGFFFCSYPPPLCNPNFLGFLTHLLHDGRTRQSQT